VNAVVAFQRRIEAKLRRAFPDGYVKVVRAAHSKKSLRVLVVDGRFGGVPSEFDKIEVVLKVLSGDDILRRLIAKGKGPGISSITVYSDAELLG